MSVNNTTSDKATTPDSQTATPAPDAAAEPITTPAAADAPLNEAPTVTLGEGAIPLDDAEPAAEGEGAEDGGAPDAPDVSAYDFALPEGFEVDDEVMGEFKGALAEMGASKEAGEKLLGMAEKLQAKMQVRMQEKFGEQIATVYAQQLEECQKHPVYGGEHYEKSRGYIAQAITRFAGERDEKGVPLFVKDMKTCGMANNPSLFGFLASVGKYISEADPLVSDAAAPAAVKSVEERLFPGYNP